MGRYSQIVVAALLVAIQPMVAAGQSRTVADPVWRLGGAGDDVQFFKPGGASLLQNADLVIANSGSREVLVVASNGTVRWKQNREGRGPGEFKSVEGVTGWRGDSIAVVDGTIRRITIFSPEGSYGRSFTLPRLPPGSSVTGIHRLDQNKFLVGTQRGRMPGDPAGLIRNPGAFLVVGEDGALLSTTAEIEGDEWFAGSDHRVLGYMPFGHVTRYVAVSNEIFVTDGTAATVRRISVPSGEDQVLALPISDRGARLTSSQVRDYKVTTLEAASAGFRPALARYLEEVPFPTHTPITRNLVADSKHNLWVEQFPGPDATAIVWTIVSPQGSALGTVTVPANVRIIAATEDSVYALERDEWGAESLILAPLRGT